MGFLSALAKYESTWKPTAVGGGGRWYGLLQILPATARHYGCRARSGAALKDGSANLACAIRIMARTVTRDGVIHARKPRWSGVAADWGPMRSEAKRHEMAAWLRGQEYCQLHVSPRPQPRPAAGMETRVSGPDTPAVVPQPRPETLRLAAVAGAAPDGPGRAVASAGAGLRTFGKEGADRVEESVQVRADCAPDCLPVAGLQGGEDPGVLGDDPLAVAPLP